MRSLDRINEYVSLLCQQIRWKKAHLRVSEEMENHIADGRDAYMEQGLDEQTATEKAIADTGDATLVGTQLDRIHRPRPQWDMFTWVAGFLVFGIFINLFVFGGWNLPHQLLGLTIGVAVMLGAYFVDFTVLGKYPRIIYGGTVLFGVAVSFFMSFFVSDNPRFLSIVQSISLLFPLAFVSFLFWARNKGYRGIVLCWMAYGLLCLGTFASGALGGFIHFAIIGMVLFVITVLWGWFGVNRVSGTLLALIPSALVMVIGIGAALARHAYIAMRFQAVFHPHVAPDSWGWLPLQIRDILSGAVLFGAGTEVQLSPIMMHYDFLLTSLISRFGWIPFAGILGALLFFIGKATMRCWRQRSGLGALVSTAVVLTFSVQVISYIMYNLGLLFTQLSLPLLSPGNVAMITNLGLIGFMLSVFRTGDVVVDERIAPVTKQGN